MFNLTELIFSNNFISSLILPSLVKSSSFFRIRVTCKIKKFLSAFLKVKKLPLVYF